jgi:hypothetical protein
MGQGYMSLGVSGALPREVSQRETVAPYPRQPSPPDITTMQHQRIQELILTVTQDKDEHDPDTVGMNG